jgi:hypothetical protein
MVLPADVVLLCFPQARDRMTKTPSAEFARCRVLLMGRVDYLPLFMSRVLPFTDCLRVAGDSERDSEVLYDLSEFSSGKVVSKQ